MPNSREVASAEELMQLLASSNILRPDELRRAKEMAQETTNCQLLARRLIALDVITRWQAGQLLVGWTKLRLGKYLLRSQIGRGEFGRVFLARHMQLEREVAINTLSRRFTQRPEIVERFLADARKVAALDHRNILHVYDIDSDQDQFFLVTEFVQGVDLQHRVEQQGPLAVDVAARILGQAAAGLAHAHERGVLHQDLQPSSLVLDEQGNVKIVGLGMGRLAASRRTLAAAEAGQPEPAERSAYAAPEEAADHDGGDAQSDIYSLGSIAYYSLTGQAPPPARSGTEPSSSPVADTADIAELRADVPAELAVVIRTMMAHDTRDRYASAAEVVRAVRSWIVEVADEAVSLETPASEASGVDSFDWMPAVTQPSRKSRSAVVPKRGVTAGRPAQRSLSGVYAALALLSIAFCAGLSYWLTRPPDPGASAPIPSGPPALGSPGRTRVRDRGDAKPRDANVSAPSAEAAPAAAGSLTLPQPAAAAAPLMQAAAESTPAPAPQTETTSTSPATEGGEKKPEVSPTDAPASKEPPPPAPPPSPKTEPTSTPDPPVNPFGELPAAIDLPSVEKDAAVATSSAPFELGKLGPAPSAPVTVSLLGGRLTGVRGARFELSENSETARTEWQVVYVEDKPDGPAPRPVAVIRSLEGRVQFHWDPGVADIPGAAHLSNCVVRWTSGTFRHDLRLRTPLVGKPLQVNLKKQPDTERIKLPAPPDVKQVRFQVVSVDEPLPKTYSLTPPEPIAVDGASVRIALGEDAESQVLLLDLKPRLKTLLDVECEVSFRLQPTAEPVVWSAKKLELAGRQVAGNQDVANQRAQQLRTILMGVAATDPTRAAQETALRQAEATLNECTKMTQAMAWLTQTREAVAKGVAIHFRMFLLVEDCEVELIRTGPAPE